ncbi:ADP-ribosylation factor-binding protein GGA2 isoform X1 [Schistocerca nitens]|uniref:ADP-ribosylation factor-binding protein GGA2 isoform X1 n=2 Tax=Schistocerca nitens TaxID=7011 RepID=UPI0021183899|nr:ADP-ribosylation factor-binding protein GGA2 isoform X1 [Schistocerca nitens]
MTCIKNPKLSTVVNILMKCVHTECQHCSCNCDVQVSGVRSNCALVKDKATNPSKLVHDTQAIYEACKFLERETFCAHEATRLLAAKIQSPDEKEAMRALVVVDTCMRHSGPTFQAEVGKFRFLNEMIKLVSPKYLGAHTSPVVKKRVLQLMYMWTKEFPHETKIREAYEMLKKQGVIKEDPPLPIYQTDSAVSPTPAPAPPPPPRTKKSIFDDDEQSRLLQRLLQSKNPDDLQAANRLIKNMVKEDERRLEMTNRCNNEIESVHSSVRLLSEMLDSYKPGETSEEELELIKELHQSCNNLRTNLFRFATEIHNNEHLLNKVLQASDALGHVSDKYNAIIVQGELPETKSTSLLDLSTPSEEKLPPVPTELLGKQLADLGIDVEPPKQSANTPNASVTQSNIEVLGDIFGGADIAPKPLPVLQPVTLQQQTHKISNLLDPPEKPSKQKALEDLDVLGETLLKQSLPATSKIGSQFSKPPAKIPMNLLSRQQDAAKPDNITTSTPIKKSGSDNSSGVLDLDLLTGEPVKPLEKDSVQKMESRTLDLLNGDDTMVDISEETPVHSFSENNKNDSDDRLSVNSVDDKSHRTSTESVNICEPKQIEVKPLNDINVSLDSIKPGSVPPLTVLDEKNGVSVILHFAKDRPREDVSVVVVTTISKNPSPLTNYLFQAVVPKSCKLRLQPPSGSELPGHSPFLPPSAITQVMLIANPRKEPVSLKFMISYSMDDDTITEMGEVEQLPSEVQ